MKRRNSHSPLLLRILFWIIACLVLIVLLLFAGSFFFVQSAFQHRVEKIAHTPEELGLNAKTIHLTSRDGLPLAAWHVPCENERAVVVLLHGMDGQNASTMLPQVGFLHNAGYEVLVLDMRAHGRSGGERIGLAFEEPRDVSALIDWIETQPDLKAKPLALLGVSMGGATALRTAAARPEVDAVISVSAFASVDGMINQGMRLMGAPEWIVRVFGPFTRLAMLASYGVWPASASPLHDIPAIEPRPVLLMHGDADSQVPVENAYRLQQAAGKHTELWIAPGAEHFVYSGDGSGPEDAFYREKVLGFLAQALP